MHYFYGALLGEVIEMMIDLSALGEVIPFKVLIGFSAGLILGIILCCPRIVTNECIIHDGIIYCEVDN